MRTLATVAIIFGFITFWVLRPVKETDFATAGFTPLRDEALAAKFTPIIVGHELYGAPTRMLYRMARNAQGEISADCRVNGEDYPAALPYLHAYVQSWPQAGLEFRKQYVVIRNQP